MTRGDYRINEGIHKIFTEKTRDKHDLIIVQEKLDGTNCGILRLNGILYPVIRTGYLARDSQWQQHRMFDRWAMKHIQEFDFLQEGERLMGEWIAQASGTKYKLQHEPFITFDLMGPGGRRLYSEFCERVPEFFPRAHLLHMGGAFSIEDAERALGTYGHHGAQELAEGAVWRLERDGKVEHLAKYVREGKVPGKYLMDSEGKSLPEVWNEGIWGYL